MGLQTKTKKVGSIIIKKTNCYSKLTPSIPLTKTAALPVAIAVHDNSIMSYDVPKAVMKNNDPRFVSKLFAAPCASMNTKLATITEYHSNANGQVESFTKTLVARLRHYIGEH